MIAQLPLFDDQAEPAATARSCPSQIYTPDGQPLFHVYGSGCEHPQYREDAHLAALLPELPPDLLRAGFRRYAANPRWIEAPDDGKPTVVFSWSNFNDNLAAARAWLTRTPIELDRPATQKREAA